MISMYSDAALEQPLDARPKARPIQVHRKAVSHLHDSPSVRSVTSGAVRPEPGEGLSNSKTLHHDSLDGARGILLALVLGLSCWIVIGGIVRIVFF
jgi:hypothetical protein